MNDFLSVNTTDIAVAKYIQVNNYNDYLDQLIHYVDTCIKNNKDVTLPEELIKEKYGFEYIFWIISVIKFDFYNGEESFIKSGVPSNRLLSYLESIKIVSDKYVDADFKVKEANK